MGHIKKIIEEHGKEIMFLENKFDKALIGTGRKGGEEVVAVYDTTECIKILINEYGMDDLEAYEHFTNSMEVENISPYKPIFINDFRDIEDPTDEELGEILGQLRSNEDDDEDKDEDEE